MRNPSIDSNAAAGDPELRKREPSTLASSVYDRLRRDILNGELSPGTKLRSEHLRKRYEAGGTPVREALNRLTSDGLVLREEQRGFAVSGVSREELEDLVQTRCRVEGLALEESIRGGDPTWEEGVLVAFHRLSRVPRSAKAETYEQNPEWERLHREYHVALISACASPLLLAFCAQLRDLADRYRQLAVFASFPKRNELEEHRAIMQSAIDRKPGEAVRLLQEHYGKTSDIIKSGAADLLDLAERGSR